MFLSIHNAGDIHVTVGCLFKKHAFFGCSFFFFFNNLYFNITLSIYSITVSQLVNWYFEPSQPQMIKIRAKKTIFSLSPIYSARKSSNRKLSKNDKISYDTNLQKTHRNIKHKMFKELVPTVLPQLSKAHKTRTRWYR